MSFDKQDFRSVCSRWATGVSVITTVDTQGKPYGLTMNGITSVSLEPPLFLICVDRMSDSLMALKQTDKFVINILNSDQQPISQLFASKVKNKFKELETEMGELGIPLINGAIATIECETRHMVDGGDHIIFIGEALNISGHTGEPLIFYSGKYQRLK